MDGWMDGSASPPADAAISQPSTKTDETVESRNKKSDRGKFQRIEDGRK